jgi:hypothetical protein
MMSSEQSATATCSLGMVSTKQTAVAAGFNISNHRKTSNRKCAKHNFDQSVHL